MSFLSREECIRASLREAGIKPLDIQIQDSSNRSFPTGGTFRLGILSRGSFFGDQVSAFRCSVCVEKDRLWKNEEHQKQTLELS